MQSNKRRTMIVSKISKSQARRQDEEIKMTKTMWMIIITFLICWLPVSISYFVVATTKNRQFFYNIDETFGTIFHTTTVFATHLNSVIDPIIYACRINEVRDGVQKLFRGKLSEKNCQPLGSSTTNGTNESTI